MLAVLLADGGAAQLCANVVLPESSLVDGKDNLVAKCSWALCVISDRRILDGSLGTAPDSRLASVARVGLTFRNIHTDRNSQGGLTGMCGGAPCSSVSLTCHTSSSQRPSISSLLSARYAWWLAQNSTSRSLVLAHWMAQRSTFASSLRSFVASLWQAGLRGQGQVLLGPVGALGVYEIELVVDVGDASAIAEHF